MSRRGPWTLHEGGPCPLPQGGHRIQIRPIGSARCFIKRAGQIDWSGRFEWRMA